MQDFPDKVNYERFFNKSLQRTLFRTRGLELARAMGQAVMNPQHIWWQEGCRVASWQALN